MIQIKERPILFSAPMIRAILDGSKTQTRRIVKIKYDGCGDPIMPNDPRLPCPFGSVGQHLWVRETWAPHADIPNGTIYRADPGGDYQDNSDGFKWHPSIHMHRWRSRITLEITDVRVERLQDISDEDAECEGIKPIVELGQLPAWQHTSSLSTRHVKSIDPITPYKHLWESINGPCSWSANPHVWAITFKRILP
jgi:hypothetical protein